MSLCLTGRIFFLDIFMILAWQGLFFTVGYYLIFSFCVNNSLKFTALKADFMSYNNLTSTLLKFIRSIIKFNEILIKLYLSRG